MDYLTNFYKSKAESLQEKINFLEKQLSDLNEQAPPARSFRAGDTSQAAWSEQELRERSRNIKKGGLFQKVSDEEQSQEWKDIQAELARREKKKTEKPEPKVETKVEPKPQAKVAPKPVETKEKPAPTRKPTEVPSAVATKKEVEQAQKVADTTKKPTALPTDVGPGRMHMTDMEGRPVSVEPKGAEVAQGTYSAKPDWAKEKAKPSTGIELDPKAAVLGIGGGLVAGKAITDIVNRQRGQGMAPKAPEAKVAPKAVEAPAKVTVPAEVPEKPVPQGAYSTKDGKVIVKGKPTVAERAALGRDLLRARMAQTTGAAPEAEVKPGDMSTKSGKVVNKGSEVSSKIGKFTKGAAKFALVDIPSMIATGAAGEEVAKSLGAGKEDVEIAGTAASFAPMMMSPVTTAAALPGYVGGKLIQKGLKATGVEDQMQKLADTVAKSALKTAGVKSKEEASKKGADIAKKAKEEREVDIGKGFASPKEAAEFAKKMQDPKFREEMEKRRKAAAVKEMERQAGGSALAGQAMYDAPEWLGKTVEKGAEGVEWAEEKLGQAITAIPGSQWVLGKAGEFASWLNK